MEYSVMVKDLYSEEALRVENERAQLQMEIERLDDIRKAIELKRAPMTNAVRTTAKWIKNYVKKNDPSTTEWGIEHYSSIKAVAMLMVDNTDELAELNAEVLETYPARILFRSFVHCISPKDAKCIDKLL
jgi:hypothetical protein